MSNYDYIKGKGNRFTSDNQPPNRGRKPKLYTIAKRSYGISLDEFKDVVNYLWQLPKDEVKRIAEKDDTPIWMANVYRSLYKDTAKGAMNTLRELIQLMFGKELATKIDVTTNGKDFGVDLSKRHTHNVYSQSLSRTAYDVIRIAYQNGYAFTE